MSDEGARERRARADQSQASEGVVSRLASGDSRVRSEAARELVERGQALLAEQRFEEALIVLNELTTVAESRPELSVPAARALELRAMTLDRSGRGAEAFATRRELIVRFGDVRKGFVRGAVGRARLGVAGHLDSLGRPADALKVVDDLLADFEAEQGSAGAKLVTQALFRKGICLGVLGRVGESLAAFEAVIERDGEATVPGLLLEAWLQKIEALLDLGREREALAATDADALIARLDAEAGGDSRAEVAQQALRVGWAFYRRDLVDDAVAVFRTLADRLIAADDPALRRIGVRALANAATCLATLGQVPEASALYEELFEHGEDTLSVLDEFIEDATTKTDPKSRTELALALLGRAFAFAGLGRRDDALRAIDDLLTRFEGERNDPIAGILAHARATRDEVVGGDPV